MNRSVAEIVREYGPFPGVSSVHGVTYDGLHVWFASGDKLNAFDPASGKLLRSIEVAGDAGTACDGRHLYQIAGDRIQKIDPKTGRVLATIPAPSGGCSGLAWAEGTLWVGQYRERKIHQIDPETGAILRTLESNRFVTGVTWIEGELWHGTWDDGESELRRVDPRTGEVLDQLEMPPGVGVSGLESDGGDRFFCGGGSSGKVRAIRRRKRDPATGSGPENTPATPQTQNPGRATGEALSAVLTVWFALVVLLGAVGAFVRPPEIPPVPIPLGAALPLIVFAAAYLGSSAFRAWILAADLRLLTAIQAWRAGGLGFLALHTHGILPGLFAWPAGLGDIAIGLTAPWVALALTRRPGFVASRPFVVWNLLGILDLVVAVSTGALSSGFVAGLTGNVTTAPMARLPLVLIPAYLVPLFVMLHAVALLQARQAARDSSEGARPGAAPVSAACPPGALAPLRIVRRQRKREPPPLTRVGDRPLGRPTSRVDTAVDALAPVQVGRGSHNRRDELCNAALTFSSISLIVNPVSGRPRSE
jgi:glutamine cyclotransferase